MTAETPARRPRIPAMKARRPDPFVEVAMTAPVFVFYQLGLTLLTVQNGADWITGLLLRLFEWNRLAYAAFVLAIGFAMYVVAQRSVRRPVESLKRIVFDSVLLSLGLLVTVGLVGRILVANRVGPPSVSVLDALILSAGAGFHEELLFRLVGFEGGTRALYLAGQTPRRATMTAAVISSIVFAIAHHIGPFGEPLRLVPFAMRVVSGLYLAAVMRFRGFATAVYTHTLYDVLVMVVLR